MTSCAAVVRQAGATDRDGVWPLAREFGTSFALSRAAFDRAFDRLLDDGSALLLIAQQQSLGTVGYLLANHHVTLFANGPVAWVEEVMVSDAVRRSGVGRLLMTRAEAWAADAGARYIALATRRASHFYQALGYEDSAVFYRKMLRDQPSH